MYPVATYPRKRDELRELVIARRNVHLRLSDGRLALVGATDHILAIHIFEADMRRDEPQQSITVLRAAYPHVFDGKGWNLTALQGFVGELLAQVPLSEGNQMEKSARLTLYAKMRAYRRAAGKPQRRRREGMGEACLLLRCAAIKQIIPCLDGETVKFFLLAAAHGNEVATAWAQQEVYRSMGYHPEKIGLAFDALVEAGLMRWIRRNYFNPVTRRKEPNVYQFNPELVYVRRALRSEAYGLSQQPFAALQKKRDENPENPDRKVRGKSDQLPVRESNQYQQSKSSNHHQRSTSGFEGDYLREKSAQTDAPGGKKQGKKPDRKLSVNSDQARSAPNSDAKSQHKAERPSTPPPTPSPDERYSEPLSDPALEALAHRVKAEAPTRIWQARQLVDTYGAAAVEWGLEDLAKAVRAGTVKKSAFGLMKTWLVKGMHAAHGETAGREWWMNQQRRAEEFIGQNAAVGD